VAAQLGTPHNFGDSFRASSQLPLPALSIARFARAAECDSKRNCKRAYVWRAMYAPQRFAHLRLPFTAKCGGTDLQVAAPRGEQGLRAYPGLAGCVFAVRDRHKLFLEGAVVLRSRALHVRWLKSARGMEAAL
jgi:hypothetical protein